MENTQRDVNITLINELALLFELLTWVHLYRRSPGTRSLRGRDQSHLRPTTGSSEVVVEIRDSRRVGPNATESLLPRSVTGTQPN